MNTNPKANIILCFGDSNTNGTMPDRTGRYPADVRWTGVLQNALGSDYYIIEEGLGGRSTDLPHYDPKKPSREGLTYFKACLQSHAPLDVLILMLGTNDLKIPYDRSPSDVADALEQYIVFTQQYFESWKAKQPRILLISPIRINDTAPRFHEFYDGIYNHDSAIKSAGLAASVQKLAEKYNCGFLDASSVAQPGEDGLHMDALSHKKLGEALSLQI